MRPFARLLPAITLAVALAACSDGNPAPAPGIADETDPPTMVPVEPDGGIGIGAGPPEPSLPNVADTIPASFRGFWDYVEGNCAAASDLRLEIGAREIEFYESLGKVTSVAVESPQSIVVKLAMAGEGETWTVTTRYLLSENGTVLTPQETEANPQYKPMPRKRCPA